MKKFKKYILIGTIGLCCVSCVNDIEHDISMTNEEEVSFNATLLDTKTANDNNGVIKWTDGDEMSVFITPHEAENFTYNRFIRKEGTFSARVRGLAENNDWYALYPYSSDNKDPEEVIVNFQTTQTQKGNNNQEHVAGVNLPMYGYKVDVPHGEAPNIQMHHLAGVFEITVKNGESKAIKVNKIEFTAPCNISGTYTTDLTAQNNEINWTPKSPSGTLVLNVENGTDIAANQEANFYFTTLPFNAEGNCIIKVTATSGDETLVCEKKSSTPYVVKAGEKSKLTYNFKATGSGDEPGTIYNTYTKATSIQNGQKYVIVSNGYALQNNNGSTSSYSVNGKVSGNTLNIPASEAAAIEWKAAAATGNNTTYGDFSFVNMEHYISRPGSNDDNIILVNSTSSRTFWSLYGSDDLRQRSTSTAGLYLYMAYSGSTWNASSQSETNAITVYVADGSIVIPDDPTDDPTPGTVSGYQLVSSEPSDWSGSYIAVSADKNKVWTGATGSSNSYSLKSTDWTGDVITGDMSSYVLTISKSGNNYYIKKGNNYYYCSYSSDRDTGMATTANQSSATLRLTMISGGKFGFWMTENTTNQYLYYKSESGYFKFGGSGSSTGVYLYKYNGSVTPGGDTPVTPPVDPTPSGTTFNLENTTVSEYLTQAASQYTDTNWSTVSIFHSSYTPQYEYNTREDIPAPVTLNWTSSASGTKTVTVYNDQNRTDKEISVTSNSNSAEIYNLIPGRTYYYTVSTANNPNVAYGSFKTEGRRRMMLIGEKSDFGQNMANNCRDLGGLKAGTETVKYGKIFRGSNMDQITADQKTYMQKHMHIGLDVDLREWYYKNQNNPLGVEQSTENYSGWSDLSTDSKMKNTVQDIINAVKAGKGVYIHCLAGADRTGYVCMLLEAILGVSQEDCSIDYELTSFSCVGVRARNIDDDGKHFREGMLLIESQEGSTFQQKAINYVKTLGISDEDVTAFQNAMLE